VAIPAGIIADKIGLRKAAGIGTLILALGALFRATATNYNSLLLFTLVYGTGLGMVFTNLPKFVSLLVPPEKAGIATGFYSAGLMVGATLSMALTVPMALPLGNTVQGVFFIWSLPPLAAAILPWLVLKETPRSNIRETTKKRPRPTLSRILGDKHLWMVGILLLLHNFFIYTWTGWAPLLMQRSGATHELAGFITSLNFFMAIPAVLIVPRLAYRLGLRKPFLWGPGIIMGLAAWAAMHNTFTLGWILMIIVGIANGTRFPIILALPLEISDPDIVGAASGFILAVGYLGAIIGPLVSGYILDLTGSLQMSMIILIILSATATIISLLLPETGSRTKVPKKILRRA